MRGNLRIAATALLCVQAISTSAENFEVLHSFNEQTEGYYPSGGMILSTTYPGSNVAGSTLFGVTRFGPPGYDAGAIYSEFIGGGPANTLHAFTGADGQNPTGEFELYGSNLYGTTSGGTSRGGTVYKAFIGGGPVTTLHTFPNAFDAPLDGVTLFGGSTLYGTTSGLGINGNYGTVFKLGIDGNGFQTLHTFDGSDGGFPTGKLVVGPDFELYGTTAVGGPNGHGTVFKVDIFGNNFQTLHAFSGEDGSAPDGLTLLDPGILYGTTEGGGHDGYGTIYRINLNGTGFETLHTFTGGSDGRHPTGGLTPSTRPVPNFGLFGVHGDILYGATRTYCDKGSCPDESGTVYKIAIDGSGFQTLHRFNSLTPYGGGLPNGGLAVNGSMLYGTTESGGMHGDGIVFAVGIVLASTEEEFPAGTNISKSYGTGDAFGPGTDFGAGVTFPLIVEGGTFTGEFYESMTGSMLENLIGSEAAGMINFGMGPLPQLWTLNFTGQFEDGALVTFRYDPAGLTVEQEAEIRIKHFKNGQWMTPAGQLVDTDANTISVMLDSFSPFLLSVPVPEPSCNALILIGMAALGLGRYRSRRTCFD